MVYRNHGSQRFLILLVKFVQRDIVDLLIPKFNISSSILVTHGVISLNGISATCIKLKAYITKLDTIIRVCHKMPPDVSLLG